ACGYQRPRGPYRAGPPMPEQHAKSEQQGPRPKVCKHEAVEKRPDKRYDRSRIYFVVLGQPLGLGYHFKSARIRLVGEERGEMLGSLCILVELRVFNY